MDKLTPVAVAVPAPAPAPAPASTAARPLTPPSVPRRRSSLIQAGTGHGGETVGQQEEEENQRMIPSDTVPLALDQDQRHQEDAGSARDVQRRSDRVEGDERVHEQENEQEQVGIGMEVIVEEVDGEGMTPRANNTNTTTTTNNDDEADVDVIERSAGGHPGTRIAVTSNPPHPIASSTSASTIPASCHPTDAPSTSPPTTRVNLTPASVTTTLIGTCEAPPRPSDVTSRTMSESSAQGHERAHAREHHGHRLGGTVGSEMVGDGAPAEWVDVNKQEERREGERMARFVRENIIQMPGLQGPYGPTPYHYADWTASGVPLKCVEDYIRNKVLPMYANTHSEESFSGRQMNALRAEARSLIKAACGADQDKDACLFVGSGSTAAIAKLVDVLDLRLFPGPDGKAKRDRMPLKERACVFIGPFEHHSNILVWRETTAHLVEIPLNPLTGTLCLPTLQRELQHAKDRGHPRLIGSFSAASNVTGVVIDLQEVARMLHRFGGLAFFDCATYASHLNIRMNPEGTDGQERFGENGAGYADGLFLSPHKFVGGPGCPGVFLAKKFIFPKGVPSAVGGGTVVYVDKNQAVYCDDVERREEPGTPDIIGSIRCGLVFGLKSGATAAYRQERSARIRKMVKDQWATHPWIDILGPELGYTYRLPVFSFTVSGLHHNFVNVLLNDLFGIQSRSGCFCAQPYMASLVLPHEIEQTRIAALLRFTRSNRAYLPGATRIAFTWFDSDESVSYVLDAVRHIADHGWRYLPDYYLDLETGDFVHRRCTLELSSLTACIDKMLDADEEEPLGEDAAPPSAQIGLPSLVDRLQHRQQVIYTEVCALSPVEASERRRPLPRENETFRRFTLPSEVVDIIRQHHKETKGLPPHKHAMMTSLEDRWAAMREQCIDRTVYRSSHLQKDRDSVSTRSRLSKPRAWSPTVKEVAVPNLTLDTTHRSSKRQSKRMSQMFASWGSKPRQAIA